MSQQTTSTNINCPKELEGTVFEIMLKEHDKATRMAPKCVWKQAREAKEFLEKRGFF
tara:strand:- start:335 stop:505 length:171 start_codon:yes stop_codon:yes gene_type:complete